MPTRLLLLLVRLYQLSLSRLMPDVCRFEPTCSEYARLALIRYGALKGSAKAVGRVLRCQPFHPGGVDYP